MFKFYPQVAIDVISQSFKDMKLSYLFNLDPGKEGVLENKKYRLMRAFLVKKTNKNFS